MSFFSTKSWKTTSAGVVTILGAVIHLWFTRNDLNETTVSAAALAIVTGIGLLVARDNDKTSEDVGVDPSSKAANLAAQVTTLQAKAAAVNPPKP